MINSIAEIYGMLDEFRILLVYPNCIVSHDELRGLKRTFALYTRMGKEYWPQKQCAEQLDGDRTFTELQDIFRKTSSAKNALGQLII